jgi:hypothetical protein
MIFCTSTHSDEFAGISTHWVCSRNMPFKRNFARLNQKIVRLTRIKRILYQLSKRCPIAQQAQAKGD